MEEYKQGAAKGEKFLGRGWGLGDCRGIGLLLQNQFKNFFVQLVSRLHYQPGVEMCNWVQINPVKHIVLVRAMN